MGTRGVLRCLSKFVETRIQNLFGGDVDCMLGKGEISGSSSSFSSGSRRSRRRRRRRRGGEEEKGFEAIFPSLSLSCQHSLVVHRHSHLLPLSRNSAGPRSLTLYVRRGGLHMRSVKSSVISNLLSSFRAMSPSRLSSYHINSSQSQSWLKETNFCVG
jgi:hypothetical protein